MQDTVPKVQEIGLQTLPRYYGYYPAQILMFLRKLPKGATLREISDDLGALPVDASEIREALQDLEDLGIVEQYTSTQNPSTMWRVHR